MCNIISTCNFIHRTTESYPFSSQSRCLLSLLQLQRATVVKMSLLRDSRPGQMVLDCITTAPCSQGSLTSGRPQCSMVVPLPWVAQRSGSTRRILPRHCKVEMWKYLYSNGWISDIRMHRIEQVVISHSGKKSRPQQQKIRRYAATFISLVIWSRFNLETGATAGGNRMTSH
jgi:hypothetical protein